MLNIAYQIYVNKSVLKVMLDKSLL